jgi:thiamine biosynthesis lipoprotein
MRLLFYFIFFSFSLFQSPNTPAIRSFLISGTAQGTTYHITYYSTDSVVSKQQVDSILLVIDSSLSLYKPFSLVNQFNKSKTGIVVDEHLIKVVTKAMQTYRDTKGIFDITVYPFTEAWGFAAKRIDTLPSNATIDKLKRCVSSDKLYWQGKRLVKKNECVQLDPNGIAQGYSDDVIAAFLDKNGLTNYLVEIGGELRLRGRKQPGNSLMKIAIEVPGEDGWGISLSKKIISLEAGAITTSGSYRKYYESKGKKISHIIDARTGYPAQNELISVTVFAKDAITADAYDNALMVMGLKKALAFVEKRPDLAAHFIYYKKDGSVADTASTRFNKFFQP